MSKYSVNRSSISFSDNKIKDEPSMVSIHEKDNDPPSEAIHKHRETWWKNLVADNDESKKKFLEDLDILLCKRMNSFQGHLGSVIAIALSQADNLLITGGFDSYVRMWDLEKDTCLKSMKEHKGCVNDIVCIPQKRCFISAASDGFIIVWSLDSYNSIFRIDSEQPLGISCMCLSKNMNQIWTSGYDGKLKTWEVTDTNTLEYLGLVYASRSGVTSQINCMLLNSTEAYLCLANQDSTISFVSCQGGEPFQVLEGHKLGVQSLAMSKDDMYLYSGGNDNSIKVWALGRTPKQIHSLDHLESSVMNLKISNSQDFLISTCLRDITVWNIKTLKIEKKFSAHKSEIYSLFIYPESNIFVTGSMDRTLKFWSIDDNYLLIKTIEGHSDPVSCLLLTQDNKILASAGYDNVIKLWSIENKNCMATLEGHEGCVTDLAYAEVADVLFSSSKDGCIKVWDMKGGFKLIATYKDEDPHPIYKMGLLVTQQLLLSAHKHPDIRLWDVNSKTIKGYLKGHTMPVNCLVVSRNERHMYSGGEDLEILMWEMKQMKLLRRFGREVHTKPISCMAIEPDSRFLVTGSEDKSIKVWSLDEFTSTHTFNDHKDIITSLKYSTKSPVLYSASRDGFFKFWDMEKFKQITSVGSQGNPINQMVVNRNESQIYLATQDCSVKIFEINEDVSELKAEGHEGKLVSISLIVEQGKENLITSSEDKTIRIWETDTVVCRVVIPTKQIIYCTATSTKNIMYCGAEDSKVRTYDPFSQELNSKNASNNFFNGQHDDIITCVCMSEDEELLFTGSSRNDQVIRAWSVKQQSLQFELKGMGGSVMKLRVNKDKTFLFAASSESVIKVFDLLTRVERSVLKGHRGAVNDIVLSHDDNYLYSGGADHAIKAWNLTDESVMETYKEHTDEVSCLLYAPTRQHLISSGKDRYINIYLTIDGQMIYRLRTRDINITCMSLSMDLKTLYSGGDKFLSSFNFYPYISLSELDNIGLEALKHYISADTTAEKSKELINFVEALKMRNDLYYIQRVNPIMFLACLPFTSILRYALNIFKYPKFVFTYEDDLLYRTLKDQDKRNVHLNTVCDYLIDNPKEIYLHQNTVEEMMKLYNNVKIQKLLTVLFNSNIKGQEGSQLIVKGQLISNPIMRPTSYIDTVPMSLNRSLIKNETKLDEIDYRITKFPLNMHNGTEFSLRFFKGLGLCQKDVILSDMKHLINYKWIKLRRVIIVHAFIFAILVIISTIHLVFYERSVVLMVICLILNAGFIFFEIACARGDFINFLKRGFNWLDAILFPFNIFTLIMNWLSVEWTEIIIALDIFLYMFRGLTYMRVFDQTRYLISMILQVFSDMISFLIIVIFWVVMFTLISLVLHKLDEEEVEERNSFFPVFTKMYMTAMGELGVDDNNTYDWIVFFIFTIIVTMAIFNLLIAIIGNTYEEVKTNRDYFDLKEKLEIISDFDNFLNKIRFNKKKKEKFHHMIVAFHPESENGIEVIEVEYDY